MQKNVRPSGIKSHQIRVFEAVVRRKSFTAAGRELRMSQPAISQNMRSLEEGCGVKLVERVGNRVLPTGAGAALYSSARHLIRVEQDIEDVLAGLSEGDRGTLVVGGNTTGGMYIVPQIVRLFRHQVPNVEVSLAISDTPTILEGILDRTVDVAVVGGPVDPRRYDVRCLCPDELVPVVSSSHEFAGQSSLSIEDIGMQPLIVPSSGSTTRAFILQCFREGRVHARIAMEFNATENIKKAVESNLGIAIISRWAIQRELALGILAELDVAGFPIKREYQLVSRHAGNPPPVVERFLSAAEASKASLRLGE